MNFYSTITFCKLNLTSDTCLQKAPIAAHIYTILNPLFGEKNPQKFLSFLSNISRNQQEFHQLLLFLFLSFYSMLIFTFAQQTSVQEDF